jgi:nucleoside 2-deoxyribosyltransferase
MIVYVAGPIRPKNGQTLEGNLVIAKDIALELWLDGFAVVCPHANTDLPIDLAEKSADTNVWLEGDLEILARCDAVVVCPHWEASEGTLGEIRFAEARKIPVFYYPDKPQPHVTEQRRPQQVRAFIDTIMQMYRVHLDKNADYSPANILGAGEIGLMTRVWDKVSRLMNLIGFRIEIAQSAYESKREPKNESIEDNVMDLAVYAIIWRLFRRGVWGK